MKYYLYIVVFVLLGVWMVYDTYKKFKKYQAQKSKLVLVNMLADILLVVLVIPYIYFVVKGIKVNFQFQLWELKKLTILNFAFCSLCIINCIINRKVNK